MRHKEQVYVGVEPVSDPVTTVYIVTQPTAIPIEIPQSVPAELPSKKVGA